VQSAVSRGAVAANYVEAAGFLRQGRRVTGVKARDRLGGGELDVRAKLVLNAAGPWADYLLEERELFGAHRRGHFSRDACFLVNRRPQSRYALAVPGASRDSDALVSRAARHLFAVPWRDCTLIGVWHRLFAERPDTARVDESEIAAWIAEMNASYPALALERDDVIYANCGLVPFGDVADARGELSFGKESRYFDHREQGVQGLVTVIGIRYTTARGDSARALDLLLEQWPQEMGQAPGRAPTGSTPLVGGDIPDSAALARAAQHELGDAVTARTLSAWLRNYGTEYRKLVPLTQFSEQCEVLGGSDTVKAEVTHAVRAEMAMRLQDVILRRTELGSGSHPGPAALEQAALLMQPLLGWSDAQRRAEVADTESVLRHHLAAPATADAVVRTAPVAAPPRLARILS
jgi:glycerol-3-phosphate dehydrogenase